MKQLILVRHAKSSWDQPALSDRDRPLNKRGRKNAPEMGSRLANKGVTVDRVLSSPANRAFTTAETLAQAIGFDIKRIEKNDSMYFEGKTAMQDIVHSMPDEIDNLMLVGHNPDMTSFFNYLCGYQTVNMPTCAIARIQVDSGWHDVAANCGLVVEYDFPKNKR